MFEILPKALIIAGLTQITCQIFKLVYYSILEKKFSPKYAVTPGGMPSAHSAFVTSLTASVGVLEGPASTAFALCAVFGVIVIYDALKLRGAVQKHAKVLNVLQEKNLPEGQRVHLSEMVGHTMPEIVVGVLVALAAAIPIAFLLKPL